ncbi:MAG TPA: ATP-binding cassette domain-containing protein [Acidimicrobiales bacterium]|nr:ATP-binding cassette domain-containing protein [Acidimicrobiales bacterium]
MALIRLDGVEREFVVYRREGRVRRRREVVRAVDGISFEVAAGEIVGYIGPNGAGKSTTIKMLTGILMPTGGTVRVDGLDPQRARTELAMRMGVVFGQRNQLWWDLPLRDSFELLRHVYRVPAARHAARLAEFVELLDLGPFLDTPVRQLSLGQKMRGEITAALLHDPSILYLDEPTIGLDVVSKSRVREFLARVNKELGVTVILTTHDLSDVERLCSRLMVIDLGRLVYDGTVDDLKARHGQYRTLIIDLELPNGPLQVDGAEVVRVEGPRQWLRFHRERTTAAELIAGIAGTTPVLDLTVEEPQIEDVISRLYAGNRTVGPDV